MRVLLLVIALLSATVVPTPVAAQSNDELTVEYRLAVIQRGRYVEQTDPLVFSFGRVLDRLTDRCQETRLQLGNGAVLAVTDLRKQGIYSATPLSVLLGLDAAVPVELYGPDNPAKCGEILGLLEYLISQGG